MNASAFDEYEQARRELDQAWAAHKAFMDTLTFYLVRVMCLNKPSDGDVSVIVLWNEFYRVDGRLRKAHGRYSRAVTQLADTIMD